MKWSFYYFFLVTSLDFISKFDFRMVFLDKCLPDFPEAIQRVWKKQELERHKLCQQNIDFMYCIKLKPALRYDFWFSHRTWAHPRGANWMKIDLIERETENDYDVTYCQGWPGISSLQWYEVEICKNLDDYDTLSPLQYKTSWRNLKRMKNEEGHLHERRKHWLTTRYEHCFRMSNLKSC